MLLADPVTATASAWKAELALGFERHGERTVLARRRHEGPLVVQKPLYPEGGDVCHAIVVHPPAGIAGGDALRLSASLGTGASALLTTPGAAKWYRSAGARASSRIAFEVDDGAALEWLPQETIVFDGALADMTTLVGLTGAARYIGWEILCLGRTGSGERFDRGDAVVTTEITRDGRPLFVERARIDGGGALLASPAGLHGASVTGTFIAACDRLAASDVAACREHQPARGEGAVTRLPGVIVARYLGGSSEAARQWFTALWSTLRPAILQRQATEPRIWRT
jgi:urease accessory protein